MRRTSILLLVIAVVSATTAVAGAAPKDRPDKPGKGGSGPIEVAIERADESTWWLHEAGDEFIYAVTVTNNSGDVVENATVVGEVGGARVFLDQTLHLPVATTTLKAAYTVDVDDVGAGAVVAEVTVKDAGGATLGAATHTQEIDPYQACDFTREMDGPAWTGRWEMTNPDEGGTCIFSPTALERFDGTNPTVADAHWTFTVELLGVTRPMGVLFTMRDDIPGNWCHVPDPASGYYTDGPPPGYYDDGNEAVLDWDPETVGGRTRWRPGDPPITRHFYFPPGELESERAGVCLLGGQAGDFMGVGNPSSFYLVAPGRVTVEPRSGFPPGA